MNEVLLDTIETCLNNTLKAYIQKISLKYSIPVDELNDLVNTDIENIKVESDEDSIISDSSEENNLNICTFIMKRGTRKGKLCGKKVKSGCDLCTTHYNDEQKKSATAIIKKSKIVWNEDIKMYYCNTTGFVFEKIDNEYKAVGKFKSGDIQKLEDFDIKTCKKFNYIVKI